MKDEFKERIQIELHVLSNYCSSVTEIYKVFSLHLQNADHIEPDFLMPLRLATIDTKLEFDHLFLSTMSFRFSCRKALRQSLKDLSATQLSQAQSLTIELFDCHDCYWEKILLGRNRLEIQELGK